MVRFKNLSCFYRGVSGGRLGAPKRPSGETILDEELERLLMRHRTREHGEAEKREGIPRAGSQNEVITQVKGGSRRGQGSS